MFIIFLKIAFFLCLISPNNFNTFIMSFSYPSRRSHSRHDFASSSFCSFLCLEVDVCSENHFPRWATFGALRSRVSRLLPDPFPPLRILHLFFILFITRLASVSLLALPRSARVASLLPVVQSPTACFPPVGPCPAWEPAAARS